MRGEGALSLSALAFAASETSGLSENERGCPLGSLFHVAVILC
jgi:hypothetical protein